MKYYDSHKERKPYLAEKEPYEGMAISYILVDLIMQDKEQMKRKQQIDLPHP